MQSGAWGVPMLIDSHCHLDFPDLAADRVGVLARAKAAGLTGMVTISTRVKRYDEITAIAEAHDNVWCSVGTHPHNAQEELDVTTEDLVRLSEHPRCVAIGEAGLDYHYEGDYAAQTTGFRRHIEAARITGLPLVIHARSADADVADLLEEETGAGGPFPFVLHCYTGGMDLARRGLALGGYVSFSGSVTFNTAAEIQDVARACPADRYLVETDAPYLAPVPHRGRPNEPSYVRHTAEKLAELRGIPFEQLARETTANFGRLFAKTGIA
jgi:TatD DNase family protein